MRLGVAGIDNGSTTKPGFRFAIAVRVESEDAEIIECAPVSRVNFEQGVVK